MNKTNYTLDQLKQCRALGLDFLVYLAKDRIYSKGSILYATNKQHFAQKAMNELASGNNGFSALDMGIAETRLEIEATAAAKYSAQKAALETAPAQAVEAMKAARSCAWFMSRAARKAKKSAKLAKADAKALEATADAAIEATAAAWAAVRLLEQEGSATL